MTYKTYMKRKIFLLSFVPIFVLYAYTSSSTVYWQDSGIYLSGIKTLGVIYPPGFPLYVISAWIWTNVLGALLGNVFTFAKLVHLYSAFWGAATAGLVGVFVWEFAGEIGKNKGNERHEGNMLRAREVSAIVVGWLSGASYSLWAQSINAEVYSLAGFIGILMFGLIFREIWGIGASLEIKGFKIKKNLILLSIIWGISFANHPLTVTFAPAVIYVVYKSNKGKEGNWGLKKLGILGLIFGFSASVFYLYLPVRSSMNPTYLWARIDSFQALVNHIIGREYFTREVSVTLFDKDKLTSFFQLFWEEFLLATPLFIYGLWMTLKRRKTFELIKIYAIYGITIYLTLFFYEGGTEFKFWLIPFYTITWLVIGYALYDLGKKLKTGVLLVLIMAVILLSTIYINWGILNRSSYTLAQEFGKNLIGILPYNSIVFTVGDQSSSISQYLQFVEGYRTDVVLVWDTTFSEHWRTERLFNKHPDLKRPSLDDENPFLVINSFIEENLDERDIFLITRNVIPTKPDLGLIPAGTFWKVAKKLEPIDLGYWNYEFSDPDRYSRPERLEHARQVKDGEGKVVDIVRVKYSDEAKNFEMQAYKNLADYCLTTYDLGGFVEVLTASDELQTWKEEQLLDCSRENYEKMFEIDTGVSSNIVGGSLERVKLLMQANN